MSLGSVPAISRGSRGWDRAAMIVSQPFVLRASGCEPTQAVSMPGAAVDGVLRAAAVDQVVAVAAEDVVLAAVARRSVSLPSSPRMCEPPSPS